MAFINSTPLSLGHHHNVRKNVSSRRPLMQVTSATATQVSIPSPVADRLLIRPHEAEEKSAGGVYVGTGGSEGSKRKVKTGEVIAVGPGRFSPEGVRESTEFFQAGDHVLWKNDFGSETIETDDGPIISLRAFNVVAKFSK